ncbi:MAG TPA: PAS domain-containing protein, partial [Roseiflexaceae bacterium]|nr:PAS domain-containing protein [Roseiflexaceae bacterium]
DRQLRIQFINRVPAGLSVERALGTSYLEYVAPEARATAETAMQCVFQTRQSTSYEIQARGPNDTLAWYATRLTALDLGADELHVLLFTEDITARKQAEEQ